MNLKGKCTLAAICVAVSGMSLTAPAQAHVSDGAAFGIGLLGLGVGAAIASDHHGHTRYVEYRDYAPPPPPPRVYYAPPPPPPPPPPAYGYEYVEHCRVIERWNPYWGRYEPSRRCY